MQATATCASITTTTTAKSSPTSSNNASIATTTTLEADASLSKRVTPSELLESVVPGQNCQLKQLVEQNEEVVDFDNKQQEQNINKLKLNQKQQCEQAHIVDAPLTVAADIAITSNSHKSKAATTKSINKQAITNANPATTPSATTITLTRTKPVEQPKISSANKYIYNRNSNNNNNNNNNQNKNISNISNTTRMVNTKKMIAESSNINVYSVSAVNTSSSNKNNSNVKSFAMVTHEKSNKATLATQATQAIKQAANNVTTTTITTNVPTTTTTTKPRAGVQMYAAERNAINLNSFTDFVRKTTTIAKHTTTANEYKKFGGTATGPNDSNNDVVNNANDDVGDDARQQEQQQRATFGNNNNNSNNKTQYKQYVSKAYSTAVLGGRTHEHTHFCSPTSVSSGSAAEQANISPTTKTLTPSNTATRDATNAIQKHLRRFELEI